MARLADRWALQRGVTDGGTCFVYSSYSYIEVVFSFSLVHFKACVSGVFSCGPQLGPHEAGANGVGQSESPGNGLLGIDLWRCFHFPSKHCWVVES